MVDPVSRVCGSIDMQRCTPGKSCAYQIIICILFQYTFAAALDVQEKEKHSYLVAEARLQQPSAQKHQHQQNARAPWVGAVRDAYAAPTCR
jgi:hypothetical protein